MFMLTKLSDLVQIAPEQFEQPSFEAIEDNINKKYADKVIHRVGLCICLYDVLSASDGNIGHGTGVVNVNVTFRLLVFRPFKGEIVEGIIGHSDPDGIRVHVNFYTDIVVPRGNLFDGTVYDPTEKVHIWKTNPGTADEQSLYFDLGETVRFRIESEVWTDKAAGGPTPSAEVLQRLSATAVMTGKTAGAGRDGGGGGTAAAAGTEKPLGPDELAQQRREKRELERKRSPYGIIASMALPGLGPTVWWQEDEAAEEGAADGQEGAGEEHVQEGEYAAGEGYVEGGYEVLDIKMGG